MKCQYKNRECPHAGSMKMMGYKELGEQEGIHEYTVCYNDELGRDITKCK